MIWSPRSVIDASPCSNDNIIDAKIPANRPSQTDPVIAANAAETKAAAKSFPSRPISKIPARSENKPAKHTNNKGVARRNELSKT